MSFIIQLNIVDCGSIIVIPETGYGVKNKCFIKVLYRILFNHHLLMYNTNIALSEYEFFMLFKEFYHNSPIDVMVISKNTHNIIEDICCQYNLNIKVVFINIKEKNVSEPVLMFNKNSKNDYYIGFLKDHFLYLEKQIIYN